MKRAKDLGIDAFALNIGTDPYTDTQLGFAYESASKNDMKVFLSFDFNWWSKDQAAAVGAKIKQYADQQAQLSVDGKVFVSSFAGDGLDVNAMVSAAGHDIFFAPNFHPGQGDFSAIQGALNWMAWPNDGNNKAPKEGKNVTVADGDKAYIDALQGKPYIARELSEPTIRSNSKVDETDLCSGIGVVLDSFRWRSLVQQELGLPIGPTMVQSMARDSGPQATLC